MFPLLDSPSTSDTLEEPLSTQEPEKHFFSNDFEASSLYPICCPECCGRNTKSALRYFFVNAEEAVYKCESSDCLFPFREFIFKNFTDNTVYRYQSQENGDSGCFPDFPGVDFTSHEKPLASDENSSFISASGNTVDIDFDIVLDEESVSSLKDELYDIKEWLEEETTQEVVEKAPQGPRKLERSLKFLKEEPIKLEPLDKDYKIEPSITPLDYLRVIKSEWKPGKAAWASRQNIQSAKIPEPKESSIRVERRLKAPKLEKKAPFRGRKVKIEPKSEVEEEKPEDPDPNLRRSSRIRNQTHHNVFTRGGIKKESPKN